MEEEAQPHEIPPPPISSEAMQPSSLPQQYAANILIKSKASTASSALSRRRSEQNLRAPKRRSGFGSARSQSLNRQSASFLSPGLLRSPSITQAPFTVGYMGLSPAMRARKSATEPASPSRGTFVEPFPRRRIAKSTSLQMMKRKAHLNASTGKQVTTRSVSFSGAASTKMSYSKGVSPTLRARKQGNSEIGPRDNKPLRRQVSQRQRSSSKPQNGKKNEDTEASLLSPTPAAPAPLLSKNGDDKAATSKEEQDTDITKGSRRIRFHDKIRYKHITHSRVDPDAIWYSKVEILTHRKRELEVKKQFRNCGNDTILNVEGLVTEKQRRAMQQRRTESREAIIDIQDANRKQKEHESVCSGDSQVTALNDDYDQDEAMAEEYERLAAPATQSALERATRLEYHVNLLWDPVFGYAGIDNFAAGQQEEKKAEASLDVPTAVSRSHPMDLVMAPGMAASSATRSSSDPNIKLRKADVKSWLGKNGTAAAAPKLPERRSSGQKNVAIRRFRVSGKATSVF
ncbi:unnamed protein product [Cylindrotheca closterium]|uniref:Uncharacterized protein n=1 Tax=Cylindrotheca closterium TaxID=2856 RepID=A0AAD2CFY9_9STRA|nr:unnamed protein product [Cylindrotheca closterium]